MKPRTGFLPDNRIITGAVLALILLAPGVLWLDRGGLIDIDLERKLALSAEFLLIGAVIAADQLVAWTKGRRGVEAD